MLKKNINIICLKKNALFVNKEEIMCFFLYNTDYL